MEDRVRRWAVEPAESSGLGPGYWRVVASLASLCLTQSSLT